VRSYLSTHGINPGKIDIEAFGVDKPKGTSSAANRRAEIYVIP
jgi:outer membrane protein OmpA-like peptidoglycan-associated protein